LEDKRIKQKIICKTTNNLKFCTYVDNATASKNAKNFVTY
jgi:hypothetical protein